MATELNKNQWIEILNNRDLTNEIDLSIFQALYSFEGHQAYAGQIGLLLGYKGKTPHSPLNSEIGRYAKRIATIYDIEFTKRSSRKFKFWDLFFNGWDEGKFFVWQLKSELINALEECQLTGEFISADEFPNEKLNNLSEGIKKTVLVNTYERNSKARLQCIKYWKPVCRVCGFDFGLAYGDIGIGYIHVHHIVPVAKIGKSYQVDPINDLVPVCPNCHSMLHTKNPPLSVEELKQIIKNCSGIKS
ncbi:MAG: HNH endonuclease [Candidatus Competibacteraceae bacterium]|nr:HNH endonuclease [Candidatus Competibacteraceae bacterium]